MKKANHGFYKWIFKTTLLQTRFLIIIYGVDCMDCFFYNNCNHKKLHHFTFLFLLNGPTFWFSRHHFWCWFDWTSGRAPGTIFFCPVRSLLAKILWQPSTQTEVNRRGLPRPLRPPRSDSSPRLRRRIRHCRDLKSVPVQSNASDIHEWKLGLRHTFDISVTTT